jgi:hypothetical protein
MERDINMPTAPANCDIKYTLRRATPEDMELIFKKARTESKESARQLLMRKLLYECGFHYCYVAWDDVTGEPCQMQWMITPEEIKKFGYPSFSPATTLKNDQVMAVYSFTFDKYRGKGLAAAVTADVRKLGDKMGFKSGIGYVDRKNIPQMKSLKNIGIRMTEEIDEYKLCFFTIRKRRKFEGTDNSGDNKSA